MSEHTEQDERECCHQCRSCHRVVVFRIGHRFAKLLLTSFRDKMRRASVPEKFDMTAGRIPDKVMMIP